MIRIAALAVLLVGLLGWGDGRPARADEPAVDVADLPPLPAAAEAPSNAATVLAASSAQEDVVVGAAKREQSLGNVASAVTVISSDRIRRFGYRTVGEAVGAVAGAYLVDDRLSYAIGIRGLQSPGDFNTRLLVLIDGATVNEAWGEFAGVGYDALVSIDDIARIEVIRGPVSSVYGTNAFYGIINIVTRGAAETPRAWAQTSVNSINGIIAGAGFAAGAVHRQLRGSIHAMERFGDTSTLPQLPGVELRGDGSSAISAALVGAYDGSFAQIRAYRYSRQSPFAPYDVKPDGPPYEQHDTQLLVEGGHTHELTERLTVAGRLFGNFYKYDDRAPPTGGSPLIAEGTAQAIGVELRGRYELIAPQKLGLTAGTEANYDRTWSGAHLEDDPGNKFPPIGRPFSYIVEGTYAELDAQPTPWLGFTAGLRYDLRYNRSHGTTDSKFDDNVSPRLALFIAAPERYGVKLLYARGFRAGSAFEGVFEDGMDFVPNPRIRAERIRSLEAVAWAKPRPGLSLRLSGFYWGVGDAIEQRAVSTNTDMDMDMDMPMLKLRFKNVGDYESLGLEAEGSYRDSRGWYVFGGFALARVGFAEAINEQGDTDPIEYGNVANAPRITASGGVSTPRLFGRVHVSSELTVLGERPTRPVNDETPSPASPAWVGWNATLYAPNLAGFDLTVGVRNILGTRDLVPAPGDYDRTGEDMGMVLVPRVPAEGREVYVKIGYAY